MEDDEGKDIGAVTPLDVIANCHPLGKENSQLWDDGAMAHLQEQFQWLLESPGIGLLTGEPGVGKTAALRHITGKLNPHRYQVIYTAETDFGRLDIYRSLALALGLDPAYRRASLWRDMKAHIQQMADGKQTLPVWNGKKARGGQSRPVISGKSVAERVLENRH